MRKCKICKSALNGRSDQVFCSTHCKNYYHSRLRGVTKKEAFAIDRHLHRNRSIILEILGKSKRKLKVPRILLETKRFHWKYHTHFHINSNDKLMHYIYDFGWMEFSDDEVLLVRSNHVLK